MRLHTTLAGMLLRSCPLVWLALASLVHADIYQWEYVNPADPSQGKQQSATLAPDGAGLTAAPGAIWQGPRDLTKAYLSNADLTDALIRGTNFGIPNFELADFTNAKLTNADLAGSFHQADFSDAQFRGARLGDFFSPDDGYDFTSASFARADLTNARLTQLNMNAADLSYASLSGAFFDQVDLTNANLSWADLSGVEFDGISSFVTIRNTNLSHANMTNAYLGGGLSGHVIESGDFTGADGRGVWGSSGFFLTPGVLGSRIVTNLIRENGTMGGLDLTASQLLVVRDYDGDTNPNRPLPPIQIHVFQAMSSDTTGTLRMLFEEGAWDSLISFEPGIPVSVGGTLELDFAPGVDVGGQLGRTIRIFDWTGVSPSGQFDVVSPYVWDISQLYTTGEVTLVPEPSAFLLTILSFLWLFPAARWERTC
jgi:uncharacterized protein YjbI with pentapeptide repeats